MTYKLSILIATLPSRINGLKNVLDLLHSQLEGVEVIYLGDNKTYSVGAKRNILANLAHGEYCTYIDDDDVITTDYCSEILNHLNGADCINFIVQCSVNNNPFKPVFYSIKNKYRDLKNYYERKPNHIMCIKRELILKTPFLDTNFGEDTDFSNRVNIKSENNINKTLYYYVYNDLTTETQNVKK